MAEKRSKSILSGLKDMLHLDPEKSSKPASKSSASTRRKPVAAEKRAPPAQDAKTQRAATPHSEPAAAPEPAGEDKTEKKKVQNQPWYRHRQRW